MNGVALTARQVRYVNKAFCRNPASAFFTFAFPLMFLVIFTSLLGHFRIPLGGGGRSAVPPTMWRRQASSAPRSTGSTC